MRPKLCALNIGKTQSWGWQRYHAPGTGSGPSSDCFLRARPFLGDLGHNRDSLNRVVSENSAQSRFGDIKPTPLVGREEELQLIEGFSDDPRLVLRLMRGSAYRRGFRRQTPNADKLLAQIRPRQRLAQHSRGAQLVALRDILIVERAGNHKRWHLRASLMGASGRQHLDTALIRQA